jgi:hypothetical protein
MRAVRFVSSLLIVGSFAGLAHADDPNAVALRKLKSKSVTLIMPVYSQLVKIGYPAGFVPAYEKAQPDSFLFELVPDGESVNNWTQMITLSGAKDVATRPNVTPKLVLDSVAAGFKRACPTSFNSRELGDSKVSGFDATAAVISCGVSPSTGGKTSETALIIAVKGKADVYTVQWAERASPSSSPIQFDAEKWSSRYKSIGSLRLCPIVEGERAPYPSCVGTGKKEPT